MNHSRRAMLQATGAGLVAGLAGCIGGKKNVVANENAILPEEPTDALLSISDLPEPEDGRGKWEVAYEKEAKNTRDGYVEGSATYKIPWEKSVGNYWRYLAFRVYLFDNTEPAEMFFAEETEGYTRDPDMKTNGKRLGDEAMYSVPKDDSYDDTHLWLRENNIVAKIVESEGWSGAKRVVIDSGKTQLDILSELPME